MMLIWKKDDYKIVAYKTGRYTALYKGDLYLKHLI